jgi:predicted phosphodiesterase
MALIPTTVRTKEPEMMLRWIHLSDWHQGAGDTNAGEVLDALVDDILLQRDIRFHRAAFDFAVFSGDLANKGGKDEYDAAAAGLITKVLKASGVSRECCVVVAGNHDIKRSSITDRTNKGLKLPARCFPDDWLKDREWNAWLETEEIQRELREPFQDFRQFALETFGIEQADWAYTRELRFGSGTNVTTVNLACFNTALFCQRKFKSDEPIRVSHEGEFKPNGNYTLNHAEYGDLFVGSYQINEGLKGLPKTGLFGTPRNLCIAVAHHPLEWLIQADRIDARNEIFSNCDFLLVGHEHEQRVVEIKSTQGECIVIPAGPTFDKTAVGEAYEYTYGIAYNMVQLNVTTGEGVVLLRKWTPEGRFAAGYRSTFPGGEYHFKLPRPELPSKNVNDLPLPSKVDLAVE